MSPAWLKWPSVWCPSKVQNLKKITVVGAGGTGHTIAADLSMRGFDVRLCDSEVYRGILDRTAASGGIRVSGMMENGFAEISLATTDMAAALKDADLVICCTVANRDEEVSEMIAPYLRSDSVVLLSAGSAGSLIYRRVFDRHGLTNAVVGETCGNMFSCRLLEDRAEVFTGSVYAPKSVATVPNTDVDRLVRAFYGVYELNPAGSILETAFNSPNLMGHLVLCTLNAGAIESAKEPYYVFRQGICRSTINLIDAVWQEKKAVMERLGLPCLPSPSGKYRKFMDPDEHQFDAFKALAGPDKLTNRYITEDTPMLVCLFLSVARALDISTPLFESLVNIISAVNQTPYYKEGRTLENLGAADVKGSDILKFFKNPREFLFFC